MFYIVAAAAVAVVVAAVLWVSAAPRARIPPGQVSAALVAASADL
jgi:hypothetical protein